MDHLHTLLIVCPFIFISGFVDSIAGGGGLISLPAFLLAGLPSQVAHGCNKFSAFIGTGVSTARYFRHGDMHVKVAVLSALAALGGSYIGTRFSLMLSERAFRGLILTAVPVMAVLILIDSIRPEKAAPPVPAESRLLVMALVFGFFIGMYDGMIGPGTGTIMIWCQHRFMGFEHVTASGNAKAANLASNVASAVTLVAAGKVLFWLAIPAAVCGIAGNWLGSGLAIKKGSRLVRGMMMVVVALMLIKLLSDYIL